MICWKCQGPMMTQIVGVNYLSTCTRKTSCGAAIKYARTDLHIDAMLTRISKSHSS